MTLIDLRMEYHRQTGLEVPLTHEFCGDAEYVVWLEEELLKFIKLKQKLIPWEKQ